MDFAGTTDFRCVKEARNRKEAVTGFDEICFILLSSAVK